MVVGVIFFLIRRYNRSVDWVVRTGRLVPAGTGRLLLSDGTPWIEDGIPAEWRRLGGDKPDPSFEDREIAQEAMRRER